MKPSLFLTEQAPVPSSSLIRQEYGLLTILVALHWPHFCRSMSLLYSCSLTQREPTVLLPSWIRVSKASERTELTMMLQPRSKGRDVMTSPPDSLPALAYLMFNYSFKNQNWSQLPALYFVDLFIFFWFWNSGFQSPQSKRWLNSGKFIACKRHLIFRRKETHKRKKKRSLFYFN